MPPSVNTAQLSPIRKLCILWTHDDNFSRDEVVFNPDKFPELFLSAGSLVQVVAVKEASAVRDFQDAIRNTSSDTLRRLRSKDDRRPSLLATSSKRTRRGSTTISLDEHGTTMQASRAFDHETSYVFVCKPMSSELKARNANMAISVSKTIAKASGFRDRMQVYVTNADVNQHSASHVEIVFRDEYLARADMWRMTVSELSQRTVYKGQNLLFLSTIKATVKNVWVNGQTKHSAYFSSSTKPVFRSESARFVLFIQMSKEMWDFDIEGTGEIMFNKVTNGFLPELFKRWMRSNARHLVSIILFTRVEYDQSHQSKGDSSDGGTKPARDFYRVVVSEMASGDWVKILYQLKKEFQTFLRDVSMIPKEDDEFRGNKEPRLKIAGTPSTASKGNILEAINLAVAQFSKDYIDRDLVRTGISMIMITPGTGVFEVDYNMLKLTTDTLVGTGIGIDLVCLSPMPLHSVPLFIYLTPRVVSAKNAVPNTKRPSKEVLLEEMDDLTPRQSTTVLEKVLGSKHSAGGASSLGRRSDIDMKELMAGQWRFAMPHWIDISYWTGASDEVIELSRRTLTKRSSSKHDTETKAFHLRCRMYELQMMGVMEYELSNISVPFLQDDNTFPWHLKRYNDNLHLTPDGAQTRRSLDDITDDHTQQQEGKANEGLRPLNENEKAYGKYLVTQWMRGYDDQVFTSGPAEPTAAYLQQQLDRWDPRQAGKKTSTTAMLSSSFTGLGSSVGTARPPPSVTLNQVMGDKASRRRSTAVRIGPVDYKPDALDALRGPQTPLATSPVKRGHNAHRRSLSREAGVRTPMKSESPLAFKSWLSSLGTDVPDHPHRRVSKPVPEIAQLASTPPDTKVSDGSKTTVSRISRPGNWLSRNISFGARGIANLTGAKAVVSTVVTTGEVRSAKLTRETIDRAALSMSQTATDKLTSHVKSGPSTSPALRRMSSILGRERDVDARSEASDDTTIATDSGPSKPIAIRSQSHAPQAPPRSPPVHEVARSNDTTSRLSDITKVDAQSETSSKDPGSLFLHAASQGLRDKVGPKPDLSTSGGGPTIPKTLSPTSAISPWLVLVNPCNPKKNDMSVASQFRRWQHVFPRPLRTVDIKWKSLCSPASVPLTNEWFPTAEQLATEYHESPYKVAQNDDDDVTERSREGLVRELIAFRLSHGFQIVIGASVSEVSGKQESKLASIFDASYMSQDGDSIYMTVGSSIHQLVCMAGGEVEIRRYSRKPTTALESSAGVDSPLKYRPLIRTQLEEEYSKRDIVLKPPREEYNWNFIDTFLAGYHDEFTDVLRFWRARFVLIPVDLPGGSRRHMAILTEDSEEEIRLEGIHRLTQLWQKHRYISPEERQFQAPSRKRKDSNPLAIEFQTRDPSAVVAAGLESTLLADGDPATKLFSDEEPYNTSNPDLQRLAQDIQGEKGVQIFDRRWHLRLHQNCFIGFDFTTWLVKNFSDIETREEAVDFGNELMKKGLFKHVQRKHPFRDGQYFYMIADEYRATRPDSRIGWFSSRRGDKSVPSTPLSDTPSKSSPLNPRPKSSARPESATSNGSFGIADGEKTPTGAATPTKRSVVLSRAMRYDVDPRGRSYRPEIINLHYDRLHNPDNCYHIRIDWMNVTAKFIEDAITSWSQLVEKSGLKLVELPIAEACSITENHPFRSPYRIKLARSPPKKQPSLHHYFDSSSFSPHTGSERHLYHKAVLRKLNFVLDVECASSFPFDVNVMYSWGRPDYKLTQYIHKSGILIAQITDDGQFLFLANRLYNNRSLAREGRYDARSETYGRGTAATAHMRSPAASPITRAVATPHSDTQRPNQSTLSAAPQQSAETLLIAIKAFLSDEDALKRCYEAFELEAYRPRASPSPYIASSVVAGVGEDRIPTLGLPPSVLTHREGSPMRVLTGAEKRSGSVESEERSV